MFRLLITLIMVASSFSSQAAQQTSGDIVINYSTVQTSFLTPETAKQYGIKRSANEAMVNISVQKADADVNNIKALTASVIGEVKNELSQIKKLSFKEVKEGKAIYYLATFRFDDKDTLDFSITVKTGGDDYEHNVKWTTQLFAKKGK